MKFRKKKKKRRRRRRCEYYDKLKQLFKKSATSVLQISWNKPAPDNERALNEEFDNVCVSIDLDDNCYTPNMENITQDAEEIGVEEQTQCADKASN